MDKYKAISLVMLGVVIGLGYSVACGSINDGDQSSLPGLPGVGVAMAQGSCATWEIAGFYGADPDTRPVDADFGAVLPVGFLPLNGTDGSNGRWVWAARCVQ